MLSQKSRGLGCASCLNYPGCVTMGKFITHPVWASGPGGGLAGAAEKSRYPLARGAHRPWARVDSDSAAQEQLMNEVMVSTRARPVTQHPMSCFFPSWP